MSYELGTRTPARRGSGVARNGRQSYTINTRSAGTSSASRARRVADGVSGYGNLAGYEGLGFSFTSLIQPAISFIPGGSFVNAGINAVQSSSGGGGVAATAPWMVGLPGPGDLKDNTRIAYAKRDHDLAISGDTTAYANLKSQAVGAATAVGKAWYNAALADVNRIRAGTGAVVTGAPTPTPTNIDTSAPNFNTADVGGNRNPNPKPTGVNPMLLAGVALVAVIALRGRR